MNISIGNTPESWGILSPTDPRQVPWDRCLDEIAEAGYEYVELGPYGYLPNDHSVLRTELDRRGLKLAGAVAVGPLEDPSAMAEIESQVLKVGELVAEMGAGFLNLVDSNYTDGKADKGSTPSRLAEDDWALLVEGTQKIGELVRDRFGLKLTFHPCADCHVEYEDQIERLLDETDPSLVSLCLDTGHHAYRGGDPAEFMRKHHDRIPYVHLKSVDGGLQQRVRDEGIALTEAVKMGVFCEPYLGSIDFRGFAEVLREVSYQGIALVEQDMYHPPPDVPLQIARRAREFFRDAGIA